MGVHDAAHANLEVGASQQNHLILAVHASITNCRVPVSEGCPQQFGCRYMQCLDLPGTSGSNAHDVRTDNPH